MKDFNEKNSTNQKKASLNTRAASTEDRDGIVFPGAFDDDQESFIGEQDNSLI